MVLVIAVLAMRGGQARTATRMSVSIRIFPSPGSKQKYYFKLHNFSNCGFLLQEGSIFGFGSDLERYLERVEGMLYTFHLLSDVI